MGFSSSRQREERSDAAGMGAIAGVDSPIGAAAVGLAALIDALCPGERYSRRRMAQAIPAPQAQVLQGLLRPSHAGS